MQEGVARHLNEGSRNVHPLLEVVVFTSRRTLAMLAALMLMVALGSACNEKAPTEANYCEDNPENC